MINFVILAFIIFMMVKQINRLRRDRAAGGRGDAGRRRAPARDPRLAAALTETAARRGVARPPSVTQCRGEARSLAPY